MQCFYPFYLRHLASEQNPWGLEVPCGKCLACRVQKQNTWALRMLHESQYHDFNSFVTLTYDDEHLPPNKSLRIADVSSFIKRLRKNTGVKLKYFFGSEYGDTFKRPHYHGIIFGLDDYEAVLKSWGKGFVYSGSVSFDSCMYCTGYIEKQLYGDDLRKQYVEQGLEAPASRSSYGLGLAYALDNEVKFKQSNYTSIKGVKKSLPRYYMKKLGLKSDGVYKEKRRLEFEKWCQERNLTEISKDIEVIKAHTQSVATYKAKIALYRKEKKF